MARFHYLFRNL